MARSIWSDLPRRLATIILGVPFLWRILSYRVLAQVFFLVVHALAASEWVLLEAAGGGGSSSRSESGRSLHYLFVPLSLAVSCIQDDSLFSLALCLATGCLAHAQKFHWIVGLVLWTVPFRAWLKVAQHFPSTMCLLLVVWNCDTGALVCGRALGHRIFPGPTPRWIRRVSPAKSMEGFVGGLLFGTLTYVYVAPFLVWMNLVSLRGYTNQSDATFTQLWISSPVLHRAVIGLTLSVLAIVGDLIESAVKRQYNAKDSGSMLPGHGGILDRFDSSILAVILYQFLLRRAGQ